MQEHCRNRIDNLKELQDLERAHRNFNSPEEIIDNFAYTSSYFNNAGGAEGEMAAPKTLEAVRQAIWNPQTWLHQKQLIEDFIFFSIMNDICVTNKLKVAYNLRQSFRTFLVESTPVLEFLDENDKR